MQEISKLGCVVMAAGNAVRFHSNKLEAELDGKTLICRALEAIPAAMFDRVVVVTQYPSVARLAAQFGFEVVENPHPDWGLSHTVRLGTEALRHCNAILYTVADQPLLDDASVERLIECWKAHPCNIVGAAHNGKRSNPNIFPAEFFDELTALSGDCGGSAVIRAHPERLLTVEFAPEELTDVDTPEALAALKAET